MTTHNARSTCVRIYDREVHLDSFTGLHVGDCIEVVRGNGVREGDLMGTATVTGFEDGAPILWVRLDGQRGEETPAA